MIQIMLYLGIKKSVLKSDIYKDVSFNSRMADKIDRLEEAGLLVQDARKQTYEHPHKATLVTITLKGLEVVRLFNQMGKMDDNRSRFVKKPDISREFVLTSYIFQHGEVAYNDLRKDFKWSGFDVVLDRCEDYGVIAVRYVRKSECMLSSYYSIREDSLKLAEGVDSKVRGKLMECGMTMEDWLKIDVDGEEME